MLWVIARRAQHRLGDNVALTRVGGDHFAAAIRGPSRDDVTGFVEKFRNLTADRFRLSGFSVKVFGRIGVAAAEQGTTNATELLALAEGALRRSTTIT